MLRLCGVFVLCSSLVQAGFVNVMRDHVVDNDAGEAGSDFYEATALESKAGFGDEEDFGRGTFILYTLFIHYLIYIHFFNFNILKRFEVLAILYNIKIIFRAKTIQLII